MDDSYDLLILIGANLDFAMNESLIQFHGEAGPAVEICFQLTNLPAGGSEVNVTGIITATNGSAIGMKSIYWLNVSLAQAHVK